MTSYLAIHGIRDTARKARYDQLQPGDRIAEPRTDHRGTVTFQTFTQAAVAIAKGKIAIVRSTGSLPDGTIVLGLEYPPTRGIVPVDVPATIATTRTLIDPEDGE